MKHHWLKLSALTRIGICLVLGIISGGAVGTLVSWTYAPLVVWDVTAAILLLSLYISLRRFNDTQTEKHARSEDPGRGAADILLILASIASLIAVAVLMVQSPHGGVGQYVQIGFGILSVIISWAVIHTIYTLRYADLYFKDKKGIDFNTDTPPTYADFAYVAFTIGMTYQVSDTNMKTTEIRRAVLAHALLSFVFGTAIIASVINFVVGLAK